MLYRRAFPPSPGEGRQPVKRNGDSWPEQENLGRTVPLSRLWRILSKYLGMLVVLVLIPVIGLSALVGGAISIVPAVRAAAGHGTRGYFVAGSEFCGRYGCSWAGEFKLPGGRVTRRDVTFDGSHHGMRVGSVVPALDTGDASDVFPRHGSRRWIADVLMTPAGAAVLVLWVWRVPLRAIRRRRAAGGTA
jgi:hypothetical protein